MNISFFSQTFPYAMVNENETIQNFSSSTFWDFFCGSSLFSWALLFGFRYLWETKGLQKQTKYVL
jgi:hypothetical protein